MDSQLSASLDRILSLEQLTAVFQPIVSLNKNAIFGYEGLIRGPNDSPLHVPKDLFAAARSHGRHAELDFLCRKIVIRQFAQMGLPGRLFINIDPASLGEDDILHGQTLLYLRNQRFDPSRVVIEITETHPVEDPMLLQQALAHYRNLGFQVALDDLGAGYAGLKLWSEVNPDYVKIDRHFIQDVDVDDTKARFIHSILEIAQTMGCETIIEGVESLGEYLALRKLGVKLAQGFYFDKPHARPRHRLSPELFGSEPPRQPWRGWGGASSLAMHKHVLSPDADVGEACRLFQSQKDLGSIAVVEGGEPVGLLLRQTLIDPVSGSRRGGPSVHKTVRGLVSTKILKIECHLGLHEIGRQLCNAADHYRDEFIVTDNGRFMGTGSWIELVRRLIEQLSTQPHHLHPLTRLPGPVLVRQALDALLHGSESFVAVRFDLAGLDAFNDRCGYEQGDETLRLLGQLLQEHLDMNRDLPGHLGNDDFLALCRATDWADRCASLRDGFAASIADRASPKKGGSIELVMAAVVVPAEHVGLNRARLHGLLDECLRQAKRNGGSEPVITIWGAATAMPAALSTRRRAGEH
jgi:EAL domain-containing protein (putative c-di-GMP-specific phosphodiesterase class I)/GGDEF domain-containing protein